MPSRFDLVRRTLLTGLLLLGTSSLYAADDFDPYKHPDAFLAKFYDDNRAVIKDLTDLATAADKPSERRTEALQRLHDEFPDVALPVLAKLTDDNDANVAAKATEVLASASMMMNHKMYGDPGDHGGNPVQSYLMGKHELVYESLRKAIADDRASVRTPAANALASQSDEEGLAKLNEVRDRYGEKRYVEIMSLASPEATGKYLESYLDSQDKSVQALVGSYLIESNQYASLVKEKILLNPDSDLEARIDVAQHVPDSRDLFPLLMSRKTPDKLFSEAIKTHVKRTRPSISPREIDILLESLDSRTGGIESLNSLQNQLIQLRDSKLGSQ